MSSVVTLIRFFIWSDIPFTQASCKNQSKRNCPHMYTLDSVLLSVFISSYNNGIRLEETRGIWE